MNLYVIKLYITMNFLFTLSIPFNSLTSIWLDWSQLYYKKGLGKIA